MSDDSISRGMAVVALLALVDREFLQDLLADPEQALQTVKQRLDLTVDDIAEVTSVVQAGLKESTPDAAMAFVEDMVRGELRPPPPPPWPIRRPYWPVRPPKLPGTDDPAPGS
jgi:hypothetical protein